MAVERITDPQDARLDHYRRLNDVAFRRRYEVRHQIFVAEGYPTVDRLAAAGRCLSVLLDSRREDRISANWGPRVMLVDPEMIQQIVGFEMYRGVVAIGQRPAPTPIEALVDADLVGVFEGITDHENLGALIRTSAALGIDALILDPTTADPWYRRSVRVSMGTVVMVPIVRSPEIADAIEWLKNGGFEVVALSSSAALEIDDWTPASRVALMVGAEGPGLSNLALDAAGTSVRIPMADGIDSLNVGHAFAIVAHKCRSAIPSG